VHFLAWDRLGGVGERQAGGDGDRIEGAFLDPAEAAARLRMAGRDVFPLQGRSWACRPGWLPLTVKTY